MGGDGKHISGKPLIATFKLRVGLQTSRLPEGANDRSRIALIDVDLGVQVTHIGGSELSSKVSKRCAERWEFSECFVANDRHGIVRREVTMIVVKGNEMQGFNGSIGGITGDDIDLLADESAV